MRTTLTLDPDVEAKARRGAARLRKPLKEVINEALRAGLDEILKPAPAKPDRTKGRPLGLRRGFSYDNISELLARAEGEDHSTRHGTLWLSERVYMDICCLKR
jgi:hypothetical protein